LFIRVGVAQTVAHMRRKAKHPVLTKEPLRSSNVRFRAQDLVLIESTARTLRLSRSQTIRLAVRRLALSVLHDPEPTATDALTPAVR
jgi:hypothetical protein